MPDTKVKSNRGQTIRASNISGKDSRVAQFIAKRIDIELAGVRSQREIAQIAGYENANVITMIKQGLSKLPLDRVPAMAKALDVDPAFLFNIALEQYFPDTILVAVREIFGTVVSKNEADILGVIREATENSDPALTPAIQNKLAAIFKR